MKIPEVFEGLKQAINKLKTKIKELLHILPFSDSDLGVASIYFIEYFRDNENKLSKDDCFLLGSFFINFQLNIRRIKSIVDGTESEEDITIAKRFLQSYLKFDGLSEHLKNGVFDSFDNKSYNLEWRCEYIKENPSSYFAREVDSKSYEKDIEILVKKVFDNPHS